MLINKIKPSLLVSLIALFALLIGCSASFNSVPYNGNGLIQNGVSYRLPRTVVSYEVNYTVFKVTETQKGKPTVRHIAWVDSGDAEKTTAVTLTPSIVGDESATFVIDTEDLAAFSVATADSKFSLSADGILTAANATFNDKSGVIIENTISAGLKLGTLATNPALALLLKGRSDGGDADSDGTTIEKVVTIPYQGSFSYNTLRSRRSDSKLSYTVPTSLVGQKVKQILPNERVSVPSVSFTFSPSNSYEKITAESVDRMLREKRGGLSSYRLKGVLVRQPNSVPVRIESDGALLGTTQLLVADAGPTSLIAIKSKPFTDRTTTLAMHESGGVSSYAFSGTSQGESATASMDSVLGKLETELPKIAENIKKNAEEEAAVSQAAASASAQLLDSAGRSSNPSATQTRAAVEQNLKNLDNRNSEIAKQEQSLISDIGDKEDELELLKAKESPDDAEQVRIKQLDEIVKELEAKFELLKQEKIKIAEFQAILQKTLN